MCSPIRNPLPRVLRMFVSGFAHVARPLGSLLARSARVPDPPWRWHGVAGPWFDNNLALLEIDGAQLRSVWLG
ncbi:alkaline phosphatase family protein, partial [Georgenia sp. 10Sc9-8]|nr:alkaline phosphatase family protein [Georgenia halotolerans]